MPACAYDRRGAARGPCINEATVVAVWYRGEPQEHRRPLCFTHAGKVVKHQHLTHLEPLDSLLDIYTEPSPAPVPAVQPGDFVHYNKGERLMGCTPAIVLTVGTARHATLYLLEDAPTHCWRGGHGTGPTAWHTPAECRAG